MLKKPSLPIQLLGVLVFIIAFGNHLPTSTLQFFYSISLMFKELLSFLLPFLVFAFISSGILSFKKNAPLVLGILLVSIVSSNSLVAFFSYFVSKTLLPILAVDTPTEVIQAGKDLIPLFQFNLPTLIRSEYAMLAAVTTGISLTFFNLPQANQAIISFKKILEKIVNEFFIPILPIYVLGFLLNIHQQGVFGILFKTYGKTFTLIVCVQLLVLFLIYFIASKFNYATTKQYIKNALPSYITAFGTMSSTAAIPVTVQCAEKNTGNKGLSEMATPILANVHLLGDAISTPTLALVTLFLFQGTAPDPFVYSQFVMYFCLSMLAVSGIPGGGIIVIIPVLKSVLGFNDTMISLITTLYLLQDGLGTAGNVMGDGALMIIVNNILKKCKLT